MEEKEVCTFMAPLNRFYVLWRHRNYRRIIIIIIIIGILVSNLINAYALVDASVDFATVQK